MPRRVKRSGVKFIEDERDHSLTFFNRRSRLFKDASELSTLTGARVTVVVESKNKKVSSFSTPDAGPIVDTFLSEDASTEFNTIKGGKVKSTTLQNESFHLEKSKAVEDNMEENMMQAKDIQETSRMAKYVYGKVEDLNATELIEMCSKLSEIEQEIEDLLSINFVRTK
ncbi:serum response factor homolog A [Setaria italica]|uniref:MADS-box domain-containing protein n=1 Tax=Setaria italica TaxID=4555 RepID=K3XPQ9_SETIT|nr:serum response factor homolog A [Setaria italica]